VLYLGVAGVVQW